MRRRRACLRRRVNAPLALRFSRCGLTSFSGLELMRRYFKDSGLRRLMVCQLARRLPRSDFGVVPMIMVLLAVILTGGRRVRHVGYLASDPMVQRFCGLAQLPSDRSVGRWLARFDQVHVDALLQLNETVCARIVSKLGLKRLSLDVDGSVISTGLTVEGARRGFNPHRRKSPSYYPITAYEAQSGQIVRVENRPGNIHDGKASIDFIRALIDQVRCDLPHIDVLECRFDAAFFQADVLELLSARDVEYAVKVPFWKALGLQDAIRRRDRWHRVDDTVAYFEHRLTMKRWGQELRVVVYRNRVQHETRKNFQLDLFDPDNGHYEYSAIATNKVLSGAALWWYMCGRGAHEKALGELKQGFAFACLPSHSYAANSAWQQLSVLAHNVLRGFQASISAPIRQRSAKRSPWYRFKSVRTERFEWLNRAGLIVSPSGRSTLDVGNSPTLRHRFESIASALQNTA